MPDDKTVSTQVQPITVAVVDGTGDGGAPIPSGTMLVTPDHQPNVIVKVVTPIVAVSIRFANAYLTALIGLVLAGSTTGAIPAKDFMDLVYKCAGLSLAGPCVALGKDLITILTGLEKRFPLATGSV